MDSILDIAKYLFSGHARVKLFGKGGVIMYFLYEYRGNMKHGTYIMIPLLQKSSTSASVCSVINNLLYLKGIHMKVEQ